MTLDELDADLKLCREHLKITKSRGTEIESFLTRFLLVHICSKYEMEVKNIITNRVKQTGDKEVISFTEGSIARIRNIKTSDLRGKVLKKFSEDCLGRFDKNIRKEALARYENIIANRDRCAHGSSINMTFDELVISHKKAKEVLDVVHHAINLQ